jgi:cell division protein FtsL
MTQLELEIPVVANHEKSELEMYRRKVVSMSNEIDLLRSQIAEETKQKYAAYIKIAELTSNKLIDGQTKVLP